MQLDKPFYFMLLVTLYLRGKKQKIFDFFAKKAIFLDKRLL